MTTSQPARGRAALHAWDQSKPTNFFTADRNLQNVLRMSMGDTAYNAAEPNLIAFGQDCAVHIDPVARQEDEIGNHPRLSRYSSIGERTESIEFHPNHDKNGALIWKSGMLSLQATPGSNVEQMALFYLLSHSGEAGHCCSIACTSGLIRALQQAADPAVRDKFLPPLLNPDYSAMQHGAQFLTEVQGGSDVGANAVQAVDHGDGTWRISGEKWFCSNINADQFLVMARPRGAKDGTGGLGAFVIPRKRDDGTTNGFYIRRLKDKLGTRTLASAEVDFIDALAYPIGAVDAGFKITVELVLNTSRLLNAVSCAGIMRRSAIEAATYACSRDAFGSPIAQYPLVQEAVADIVTENYAATATGFALARLLDKIETGTSTDDDKAVYRLLVNLNKYVTSIRGSESIHRAIEVLGGNGAIESFSVLPRLYRDMLVLESWEGTHNVLCVQVLRDLARYNLQEPFARFIHGLLTSVHHAPLAPIADEIRIALADALHMIHHLTAAEPAYQQSHARRLADVLAHTAQAALLLREAEWELDQDLVTAKADALRHFIDRRLRKGYDPMDDTGYLARLQRLFAAV